MAVSTINHYFVYVGRLLCIASEQEGGTVDGEESDGRAVEWMTVTDAVLMEATTLGSAFFQFQIAQGSQ